MPDLKINRLSKWGAVIVTTTAVPVVPGALAVPVATNQFYMAQLRLDVNTNASNTKAFEADKPKSIFTELKDLALEIAEKGDIP